MQKTEKYYADIKRLKPIVKERFLYYKGIRLLHTVRMYAVCMNECKSPISISQESCDTDNTNSTRLAPVGPVGNHFSRLPFEVKIRNKCACD